MTPLVFLAEGGQCIILGDDQGRLSQHNPPDI